MGRSTLDDLVIFSESPVIENTHMEPVWSEGPILSRRQVDILVGGHITVTMMTHLMMSQTLTLPSPPMIMMMIITIEHFFTHKLSFT